MAKRQAEEINSMCNSALLRVAPMAIFVTNMLQMNDVKDAIVADV